MSGSTITTLGDYTLIGAPMWVDGIQETRGKINVVNSNKDGGKRKDQFEMIPCGVCKSFRLFVIMFIILVKV